MRLEERVQLQLAPERQAEQGGPQLPRPLQPDALDHHLRHLRIVGGRGDLRGKQFQLMPLTGIVKHVDGFQPPRLRRIIQLAEMTERPLTGAIRRAHRFDERPIRMPLPIFVPMMRPQKHWRADGRMRDPGSQEGRSALHRESDHAGLIAKDLWPRATAKSAHPPFS